MIVDGKRVFLKKLWLALLGSKFSELQVKYDVNGLGIRWQRDNAMICVSLFCKRENFRNHLLDCGDSKPSSWKSFSFEDPLIAPVIARAAFY